MIRAVTNPPGIIHVCQAANLKTTDYLAVSRYSHAITAELAAGTLESTHLNEPDALLDCAWHAAAALKLRGMVGLVCPAFTSASWDTISAHKDQKLRFQMLDDVPRMLTAAKPKTLTVEDLHWVRDHRRHL